MLNRLKRAFTQNIGLKVMAAFFAVALWLIVMNVDDPTTTRTFTATVTILNDNVLTDQGKYYTVANDDYTVSFRVTAKRSIIEDLSNKDFTATADMNYLTEDNTIPIDIVATSHASAITMSAKTYYISIEIGDTMTERFVINGKTTGDPAEGYAVNSVDVTPNVVTVTGPEETVSKIEKVEAVCDVSGLSDDITDTVVLKFLDTKGNKVDTSNLTLNASTVTVTVKMDSTKTVPINVETAGTLPNGLELDKITTSPSEIAIKGDASILNDITEITIPSSVINLSTVTADMSTTVDITSYLPDGVTIQNSDDNTQVTISVTLEKEVSQSVSISTSNLTIRNLSKGLSGTFDESSISVTMNGNETALSSLDSATITGSVDASGLTAGTYNLEVTLSTPDGVTATTVTAKVTIVQEEE
jgi:YbbR domain-containing protein